MLLRSPSVLWLLLLLLACIAIDFILQCCDTADAFSVGVVGTVGQPRRPVGTNTNGRFASTLSAGSVNPDDLFIPIEKASTLPRLYVGPSIAVGENGNDDNDNKPTRQQTTSSSVVAKANLGMGSLIRLNDDQSHYLTTVMRLGKKKSKKMPTNQSTVGSAVADYIRVFDGSNGEWLARLQVNDEALVDSRGKRRRNNSNNHNKSPSTVQARCVQLLRPQPVRVDSTCAITGPYLFFCPIKKTRVKTLLEKGTELGAGRFIPVQSERTDAAALRDCSGVKNLSKLSIQILEASEQCERLSIPHLSTQLRVVDRTQEDNGGGTTKDHESVWSVLDVLERWTDLDCGKDRHLLICRERSESSPPLLQVLQQLYNQKVGIDTNDMVLGENCVKVAFLVGPEGGWSQKEEQKMTELSQSCAHIHGISLGQSILRAETAAMAALALHSLYVDSIASDAMGN